MGEDYCSKCDGFVSSRIFNSGSQLCDTHNSQKVLLEGNTNQKRIRKAEDERQTAQRMSEAQKKAISEARKKGRVSSSTVVAYKGVSCGETLGRMVRVEMIISKCGNCGQPEEYFPVE